MTIQELSSRLKRKNFKINEMCLLDPVENLECRMNRIGVIHARKDVNDRRQLVMEGISGDFLNACDGRETFYFDQYGFLPRWGALTVDEARLYFMREPQAYSFQTTSHEIIPSGLPINMDNIMVRMSIRDMNGNYIPVLIVQF